MAAASSIYGGVSQTGGSVGFDPRAVLSLPWQEEPYGAGLLHAFCTSRSAAVISGRIRPDESRMCWSAQVLAAWRSRSSAVRNLEITVSKRTFQPNNRRRAKVHGFRLRMRTRAGRAILSARRRKGRDEISA
jgi:large subunit ribosomal protein L34